MSAEDIDTGERWSINIATKLQETDYGIICITPQNIVAPWLLFESGALSKISNARVSPILFGLEQSDLSKSPLLQFQVSAFNESEIKKLLVSINNSAPEGEKVTSDILSKSFRRAWAELYDAINAPEFQSSLLATSKDKATTPILSSSIDTAVQEILANTRSQLKLLNSPQDFLPSEYIGYVLRENGFNKTPPLSLHAWSDLREGTRSIKDIIEAIDELSPSISSDKDTMKALYVLREKLQESYTRLRRSTDYIYERVTERTEILSKRKSLLSDRKNRF